MGNHQNTALDELENLFYIARPKSKRGKGRAMKGTNPYLNFAGDARDALELYTKCFGGKVVALQTYGDANMADSDAVKDKIIHSEFHADGVHFMAADDMRGFTVRPGNNITMMVDCSDTTEQDRLFDLLSEGGTVTMPLTDAFWGARFGELTDRFGIQWMLNCAKT